MTNDGAITLGLFLFGLMAQLDRILARCGLGADEMFILFYIRHYGKERGGEKIVLRRNVTAVMKHAYGRSDVMISKCIGGLLNQGFLSGLTLKDSEKKRLFGSTQSRRSALVLRKKGLKKADEFSKEIGRLMRVGGSSADGKTLELLNGFIREKSTDQLVSLLDSDS